MLQLKGRFKKVFYIKYFEFEEKNIKDKKINYIQLFSLVLNVKVV